MDNEKSGGVSGAAGYAPVMSIITGRGDSGETDLLFGKRISKGSQRIACLGAVDELNAALGVARAEVTTGKWVELVDHIQAKLVGLMGQLAVLPGDELLYREKGYAIITAEDVQWLTDEAHAYEKRGIRFEGWARPGEEGCLARAQIDMARSIARRAEREIWQLHESGEAVPEPVRLFMNRLSDLLWILARVEPGN